VRQLLSHTSGIDDSYEIWADNDCSDLASYVRRFEKYAQVADPGEVFLYSDAGTAIAALLIERLLGMPWRRAVNTMLLDPLEITNIPEGSDFAHHYGGSAATGYLWDAASGEYQPVPSGKLSMSNDNLDSLSVCFTLDELVTLARFALDDGVTRRKKRLLSAELARQMRIRQVDVPGHHLIHSWGLGWMHFDEESFGFESVGPGQHNFIQIFPERRMVLVLVSNAYPSFVVYYDVLRPVTGQPWQDARPDLAFDIALCTGTFSADGFRLIVTRGGERLDYRYFKRRAEDEWFEYDSGHLVPSGSDRFSATSARNILRGSITPIWSGDGPSPKFVRFGQRLLRRIG
jgi:CubicO group peptidase (beta-lactamase class C family)